MLHSGTCSALRRVPNQLEHWQTRPQITSNPQNYAGNLTRHILRGFMMAASHLKAAPPQGQRIRQRIQAVQLQFWSQLFRGRRLGERRMSTSTALPPVRKAHMRRANAQIPVLHTLRPDTIVSRREKVHDFSEMAGPLLRTANQGKCQLYYVVKHIKTGKASHIPYPSNTKGYLYYHVPQGRSELAGGIRFRLCEGPEDFERGVDLYTPSGQPWGYTLLELATVKRCKPLLALILAERFVDETMIHDLSKLNLRGRCYNKALNIYTLTDPFVFDLAAGRKPCTVRILTRKKVVMVNFSAQEFAGLIVRSHDGTRNRVYPLTGSVRLQFELSTLPEHAPLGPTLVLRVLEVVEPISLDSMYTGGVVVPPEPGTLVYRLRFKSEKHVVRIPILSQKMSTDILALAKEAWPEAGVWYVIFEHCTFFSSDLTCFTCTITLPIAYRLRHSNIPCVRFMDIENDNYCILIV